MCGRYAQALRPSQVRAYLEDEDMPVASAPEDDAQDAPRQSHNFAPGYHGVVYRADTPYWGAGPQRNQDTGDTKDATGASSQTSNEPPEYKLQSMKWGLVPFWTKRNPDYGSIMRTINCRDDSLAQSGGMWTTMKARKRCVVIAQGFFEWLKASPKEKVPHFVKRKDGKLMCFAGLWDCVQYEDSDDQHYTYTIITTDSNKQLSFLHDRMPVILEPGSECIRTWLDPRRREWSKELQSLLKPCETGLDIYPVSKDVGKVGNDSPSFLIPVNSKENKANIANFFDNAKRKASSQQSTQKLDTNTALDREVPKDAFSPSNVRPETHSMNSPSKRGAKEAELEGKAATKKHQQQPITSWKTPKGTEGKISATRNEYRSPSKSKTPGTQKITKFFGNGT